MIAESFERIHRSNLVGMGLIPLQFLEGQTAELLGLTGRENYSIVLPDDLQPGQLVTVQVMLGQCCVIDHRCVIDHFCVIDHCCVIDHFTLQWTRSVVGQDPTPSMYIIDILENRGRYR